MTNKRRMDADRSGQQVAASDSNGLNGTGLAPTVLFCTGWRFRSAWITAMHLKCSCPPDALASCLPRQSCFSQHQSLTVVVLRWQPIMSVKAFFPHLQASPLCHAAQSSVSGNCVDQFRWHLQMYQQMQKLLWKLLPKSLSDMLSGLL